MTTTPLKLWGASLAALLTFPSAGSAVECKDPLPVNPDVVTKAMKLKAFSGSNQVGPVCHLSWEGGASPSLLIYGPSAMAGMGRTFTSAKQAADQYAGESPRGVEPLPGVPHGFMVFDPETLNRRLFVEYRKRTYMIASQDQIPVAVLAAVVLKE